MAGHRGARVVATADLQLGMRRRYLDADAQARFAAARVDALRRVGALAAERGADAVVVAGDVFESNLVDRRTVGRACDALAAIEVPVLLLPGNHDPLVAASVFTSSAFRARCPSHVEVLADVVPRRVTPSLEVVGAPWTTKRPQSDLVADACDGLSPSGGVLRVLVGHGATDGVHPHRIDDPALIRIGSVEAALADGRVHAVVLGDRHSTTSLGATGRVWHPGAPEPTDPAETAAGNALVVDVHPDTCAVEVCPVGTWRFVDLAVELLDDDDVDRLTATLGALPQRERTIAFLQWSGAVTLAARARLEQLVDEARDVFACLDVRAAPDALRVVGGADSARDGLVGFGQWTFDALHERAEQGEAAAADALALLVRLAGAGQSSP